MQIPRAPFSLNSDFLNQYRDKQPEWGPLGYLVYKRTYAAVKDDGVTEEFWETCKRVIEGMYQIQKGHCKSLGLPWSDDKAQKSAQEAYKRMFEFKWLPPGRGLSKMGTEVMFKKGGMMLNNCGFVSTKNIGNSRITNAFSEPFCWLMDASCLGVGVGFDTKGAGTVEIMEPKKTTSFIVEDSREGWVDYLRALLESYVDSNVSYPIADYSKVRPKGSPIKTFGGTASGPEALELLTERINKLMARYYGKTLDSRGIVDIANSIGECVVSGGTRRCMPEGTPIHTRKGVIPIEKVQVGDEVVVSDGYSKVTDSVYQGKQKLLRIITNYGEFECTNKHRMAVFQDFTGKYTWKKAHELTAEDQLVFVRHVLEGDNKEELPSLHYAPSKRSSTLNTNIQIPALDAETAWFFGYMHGDGYVAVVSRKGWVDIAVDGKHLDIKDRIIKFAKRINASYTIYEPKPSDESWRIKINSTIFAKYLSIFKQPNASIRVPDFIFTGTPEIRGAYLSGVVDADGSKGKPFCLVSSVYPEFVRDLQVLCASLGILTRISDMSRFPSRIKKTGWKPLKRLLINSYVDSYRLNDLVCKYGRKKPKLSQRGTSHDPKVPMTAAQKNTVRALGIKDKDYLIKCKYLSEFGFAAMTGTSPKLVPIKIIKVEPSGRTADTYDLSVEKHELVAGPGLLVHNTAEIAFGEPEDTGFIHLKDYVENPDAKEWPRWASNNSVIANENTDFSRVAKLTAQNGEPGYLFLDNARRFGRMKDPENWLDKEAVGSNPCYSGDTLVATADGRNAVTFKELAETGEDVAIYTMDDEGQVSIAWGLHPRVTRKNAKLVRVHLDNGTYIDVTPDHKMLLKNGKYKEAKDLIKGDSLPRFTKRQEPVKKGGNKYWRVSTDTNTDREGKIFEHRLIADFFRPNIKTSLYDESRNNGWIKGGLVVHHKNYDPLDNTPDNLEWMTFEAHRMLHSKNDFSGENNPMYGKTHCDSTKEKIGQKSRERWATKEFRKKQQAYLSPEVRKKFSDNFKQLRETQILEQYIEYEKNTGLDTVWFGNRLHVKKTCEICNETFTAPWAKRQRIYCSNPCTQNYLSSLEYRKQNLSQYFEDRQKQILHDQIMVFKDLEEELSRAPKKKEWESRCKEQNVPFRIRAGKDAETVKNSYALKSFNRLKERAAGYNHRVTHIEELPGLHTVYDLGVDKTHNLAIIPTGTSVNNSYSGIFCFQCNEQTLHDAEICCLVETFPSKCNDLDDYLRTLKFAYLYAKTVTLVSTHHEKTNAVMLKNRRIGCSQSGTQDNIELRGLREHLRWCDEGYKYICSLDELYSNWLAIRTSIKKTSQKPSGSVSKLCSVREGIHESKGEYELQAIRIHDTSPLLPRLKEANFRIEDCKYARNTKVVYFPMHYPSTRSRTPTMWEQLEMAALMQEYWADNQISVTIDFDQETEGPEIQRALEMYAHRLKGVSFLPRTNHNYAQPPKQVITKEEYEAYKSQLKPLDLSGIRTKEVEEKFCDGGVCEIK